MVKGWVKINICFFFSLVLTSTFLDDLIKPCEEIANAKAKNAVEKGEYQQHLVNSQMGSGKYQDLLENDGKVIKSSIP